LLLYFIFIFFNYYCSLFLSIELELGPAIATVLAATPELEHGRVRAQQRQKGAGYQPARPSLLSVDDESLRSLGSYQLLLQLRETLEVRGSFEFEKLATSGLQADRCARKFGKKFGTCAATKTTDDPRRLATLRCSNRSGSSRAAPTPRSFTR
jgi:hypothetical protein